MPKLKTNSSAKKRFRVSASGRVKARRANRNHINTKRTTKQMRHARAPYYLNKSDNKLAQRMLAGS